MWKHKERKTVFCLCVDDFGVKYHSKEDTDHLLQTLGNHYTYTIDWLGKNFCGLTFGWDYAAGHVDVSIPGYVLDTLRKLQHVWKKQTQYSPYEYIPVNTGNMTQHSMLAHKILLKSYHLPRQSTYNPLWARSYIMQEH